MVTTTLSPTENLAIGCLGGAVESTLQMPIVTYKFCSQEGRAFPKTVGGWYRGVFLQASTVAPITAVQFLLNGIFQQFIVSSFRSSNNRERTLSDLETLSAAFAAGALSGVCYGPVDLVTIQQQKLRASPLATVQMLVKDYGARSLFRGLSPTIVRESLYTAGYLGLSPVIAHKLMQKSTSSKIDRDEYQFPLFGNNPFLARIVGACIAGTFAAIATNPADCCKTLVQSDMTGETFPNARVAFLNMWRGQVAGGIRRVWRGLGPRTVRLSGAFFVCISFQEIAIDWKTKRKGPWS
eukprot:g8213.t1 g8213   contig29:16378-17262(+)